MRVLCMQLSPLYDTEENRVNFIEKNIDAINKKLIPIIHRCDGIHRVHRVILYYVVFQKTCTTLVFKKIIS